MSFCNLLNICPGYTLQAALACAEADEGQAFLHWNEEWRKSIYALGKVLKDKKFSLFINAIDIELHKPENTDGNLEALDFIKSEILYLNLPEDMILKYLAELIAKYPLNPEFQYSIGHIYRKRKQLKETFDAYHYALRLDNENIEFINTAFNSEVDIIRNYIKSGEYEKATKEIEKYKENKYLEDQIVLHNFLVNLRLAIEDYELFDNKIKTSLNEVQIKIEDTFTTERKRVIEIITIFSAIISFILSSVAIGKDFNLSSGLYFLTLLAFILIAFVILMNLFFIPQKNKLLTFSKVFILVILLSLSIFILYLSENKKILKDPNTQTNSSYSHSQPKAEKDEPAPSYTLPFP